MYKKISIICSLILLCIIFNGCKDKTISSDDFFDKIESTNLAEVNLGYENIVSEEVLNGFKNLSKSDIKFKNASSVDGDKETGQQPFIINFYTDYSNRVYQLQFFEDGDKNILGDDIEVWAYKYTSENKYDEAYFVIKDKDFIATLDRVCQKLKNLKVN